MIENPHSLWDWLASQDGHAFAYTVIVLLQTLSAYLGWRLRKGQRELQHQMDGHLEQHTASTRAMSTTHSEHQGDVNDTPPRLDPTP